METVTSQAKEADEKVQQSEDLLKVFGSTLKMVNFNIQIISKIYAFGVLNILIIGILDSQFSHNANGKCIEIETIHDHTDSSLFYGK